MFFTLDFFFLEFENHSGFPDKMIEMSFDFIRPYICLNNMNVIFPLVLVYCLNHLLLKFDFIQKIAYNINN
jgi:hypothetical protein